MGGIGVDMVAVILVRRAGWWATVGGEMSKFINQHWKMFPNDGRLKQLSRCVHICAVCCYAFPLFLCIPFISCVWSLC